MKDDLRWVQEIKARGWADALRTALDALEPLGVLGAQMLWIAQPAAGLIGGRQIVAGLAAALEDPDGITELRALLDDSPDELQP